MRERGAWGFGIARSHAVGEAQSRLRELCEIASAATGAVFYPHHALSYRDLESALEHGDVGVAWMPPIPAIELEDRGAAVPLALPVRRGGVVYHSAIVVRRGGPRAIEQLKGRRVAWVDRESAAGYLVPRIHLASLGFDIETFFGEESFHQSHLGAVDAVVTGRADVGATFCTLEPATKRVVTAGWTDAEGATVRPVDVVTFTGAIPNDALVASSRLPTPARTALTRWILNLDARARALATELFHAGTFRLPAPNHYDPLRHTLRAARARGYDPRALRPSVRP